MSPSFGSLLTQEQDTLFEPVRFGPVCQDVDLGVGEALQFSIGRGAGDEYRAPQQGDSTRQKGAGGEQVQGRHSIDRRPRSGCAEPEDDSGSDAHRFSVIAEEFGWQVRRDLDKRHLLVRVDDDTDVDTLVDKQLIIFTEMAVKFVHERSPYATWLRRLASSSSTTPGWRSPVAVSDGNWRMSSRRLGSAAPTAIPKTPWPPASRSTTSLAVVHS